MSISLSILLLRSGQLLGVVTPHTTTTAPGNATHVISTDLANYYPKADQLNAVGWIRLPLGNTGATTAAERKITDYDGLGDCTVNAFGGNISNAISMQVWMIAPDIMRQAILQVIRMVSPSELFAYLVDESIVVDGIGSNMDFETWTNGASSAPDSWTLSGAGASVARNSDRVWHGTYSAALTSAAATAQLTQNVFNTPEVNQWVGKTANFFGRIHATGATGRLRITFDGSTYYSSDYHSTKTQWEGRGDNIQVQVAIPDNATELTLVCETLTGTKTAIFDRLSFYIASNQIERYALPTAFGTGRALHNVYYESDLIRPNSRFLPVDNRRPPSGSLLRLEGKAQLTEPSTDAATTETDGDRAELICAMAALQVATSNPTRFKDRIAFLQDIVNGQGSSAGLRDTLKMTMAAQFKDWWKVDQANSLLILKPGR